MSAVIATVAQLFSTFNLLPCPQCRQNTWHAITGGGFKLECTVCKPEIEIRPCSQRQHNHGPAIKSLQMLVIDGGVPKWVCLGAGEPLADIPAKIRKAARETRRPL